MYRAATRHLLRALVVAASSGCGGGGGAGDGGGGAPIPLSTNLVTTDPPTITYSVTGTYGDGIGLLPIGGTLTRAPLPAQTIHLVTWPLCVEGHADLTVAGTPQSGTSRTYGEVRPQEGWVVEGARRLLDGTDVYWSPLLAAGPDAFVVGDGWDLADTPSVTADGRDAATEDLRLSMAEYRWHVDGTADVHVPAGWYECYVVTSHEVVLDGLTGARLTTDATYHVRPELGPLHGVIALRYETGTSTVTSTTTISATSIVP